MGAVMRRRRRACFSARRRRPAEAPRMGGRGRVARAPAQKQRADKPHLSGQPDGGRFRAHETDRRGAQIKIPSEKGKIIIGIRVFRPFLYLSIKIPKR